MNHWGLFFPFSYFRRKKKGSWAHRGVLLRLEGTPGTSEKPGSQNPLVLNSTPLRRRPPRRLPEAEPSSSLGKGCFPSRRTKHRWRFQEGTGHSVHSGGLQPGFLDRHGRAFAGNKINHASPSSSPPLSLSHAQLHFTALGSDREPGALSLLPQGRLRTMF